MSTIKDIAKLAQVSTCTVSRYLNHNMRFKKETEDKIKEAIKELNYVPNTVARSLKTNRTKSIAVIVPKINHLYYSEITSGISKIINQYDYNLFIYEVENSNKKETEILNIMLENMIAGIIFIGLSYDMGFKSNLKIVLDSGIPVVYVNRDVPYEGYPLVYPDYSMAGILAAEHLLSKNRRNIALVNKNFDNIELYHHIKSFIKTIKEHNISITKDNMIEVKSDADFLLDLICKIKGKKIDGIFVTNELLAVNLIKSLVKNKIKVPEDVSVIGFGNTLLSELVTPELSCIDLQNHNIGIKSAEVLLNIILKRDYKNLNVLEPVIVQRNST